MNCCFFLLLLFSLVVSVTGSPLNVTSSLSIWQGIDSVHGVTVSSTGHVFMSDPGNNRIIEYDGISEQILTSYYLPAHTHWIPSQMMLDENHQQLYILYGGLVLPNAVEGIFVLDLNTRNMTLLIAGVYNGFTIGYDNINNGKVMIYTIKNNAFSRQSVIQTYNNLGEKLKSTYTIKNINNFSSGRTGIAVDQWMNVYVMDQLNKRILKVNSTGTTILTFSVARNLTGQCGNELRPASIAIFPNQPHSNIYITFNPGLIDPVCPIYNFIGVYNATGTWLQDISIPSIPNQHDPIEVDAITIHNTTTGGTSIYVVDTGNSAIIQLDINTHAIQHIFRSPYTYVEPAGIFVARSLPNATSSTSVYVIDNHYAASLTHLLVLDSVTGMEQARYPSPWFSELFLDGVLVDSRGYIYLIDSDVTNGKIAVMDPFSGNVTTFYNNTELSMNAFTMDSNDNIYVQGRSHDIGVLYYNATIQQLLLQRIITLNNIPNNNITISSLAIEKVGSSPSIYISDVDHSLIYQYDLSGHPLHNFTCYNCGSLTIDLHGNLYISSSQQHILKYTTNGCEQVDYGITPDGPVSTDIVLETQYLSIDDHTGSIYYSDHNNHRIIVFPTSHYTGDCTIDSMSSSTALSNGSIAGIVIGSFFGVISLIGGGILLYRHKLRTKEGPAHIKL